MEKFTSGSLLCTQKMKNMYDRTDTLLIQRGDAAGMIGDFEEIEKIRELLGDNPRGMSITEISRGLGIHRTTVAKYLDSLQMKGEVDMRVVSTAKIFHPASRIPARTLVLFTRDPFLLLSFRGVVVAASQGLGDILGLSRDPTGCTMSDPLLAVLVPEKIPDMIRQAIHGSETETEITLQQGGRTRWLHLSVLPVVFDDGRPGCGIVVHDNSPLQEALLSAELICGQEETLSLDQSEFVFRARPDATLTYVNDAFCARMERRREDLIGFPYEPVISHEDQERLSRLRAGLSRESPTGKISFKAIQPDGMVSWEEWIYRALYSRSGALAGYQAVGKDISDRRHLEDQLQTYHTNFEAIVKQRTREMRAANQDLMAEIARRERLERELMIIKIVFDHASDSILLFEQDGSLYRANETACTLLGYASDEIRAITVFDINPEITPDTWSEMWISGENQDGITRVRSVHRRSTGEIIPVEVSRTFITAGPVSLFCSIARLVDG